MVFVIGGGVVLAIIFYRFAYHNDKKLRVLMYHKIDENRRDMLTVSTDQLDKHLYYLRQRGYQFISTSQLIDANCPPPLKSVLITFDDAYVNNIEFAYPILKKHGAHATIFVPTAFVGKGSHWDITSEPIMTVEQLHQLDSTIFELALHSHTHRNYASLTEEELEDDLRQNIQFFEQNQLPFVRTFAYPYGGRPKDKTRKKWMQVCMAKMGISLAFRIGNRLNAWPLPHPYEIQRIDIRGTDTMVDFARKIKWGKMFWK
ncbi:MAG: polysaccharide deacetylase family protein [Spirosomataceae bacterium]